MQKFLFPLMVVVLVGLSLPTMAQSEDFKSNVALSYNYTFTGTVLNSLIDLSDAASSTISKKSFPSLQIAYDFGINQFLSVGVAASYQSIGFDNNNYTFTDSTGMSVTENFTTKFTRMSIAVRPLFHYANSDRLDMYSGLRIQYFNSEYSTDSSDPDNGLEFAESTVGFNFGGKIGIGIVAYGIRYYLTENIGIGWELNIGRPYVTNLSVNARF